MSAVFSADRKYRYLLERDLTTSLFVDNGICVFIGLNGSKGSETQNDPTLRRCIGFAQAWNYSKFRMTNLYGLMSTDPKGLWEVEDPIGPQNDSFLLEATADAKMIVCAWGNSGSPERSAHVIKLLKDAGRKLHCLKLNADLSPSHPLYLKSDLVPIPYEP